LEKPNGDFAVSDFLYFSIEESEKNSHQKQSHKENGGIGAFFKHTWERLHPFNKTKIKKSHTNQTEWDFPGFFRKVSAWQLAIGFFAWPTKQRGWECHHWPKGIFSAH